MITPFHSQKLVLVTVAEIKFSAVATNKTRGNLGNLFYHNWYDANQGICDKGQTCNLAIAISCYLKFKSRYQIAFLTFITDPSHHSIPGVASWKTRNTSGWPFTEFEIKKYKSNQTSLFY